MPRMNALRRLEQAEETLTELQQWLNRRCAEERKTGESHEEAELGASADLHYAVSNGFLETLA